MFRILKLTTKGAREYEQKTKHGLLDYHRQNHRPITSKTIAQDRAGLKKVTQVLDVAEITPAYQIPSLIWHFKMK